jgi:Transposase DNA-binding/Transposase DDE domain
MGVAGMSATFGRSSFGGAVLGDARRTARLVRSADALLAHPGGTLPQKLSAPGPLKGFYRLMNRPEVTHAAVLAPAIEQVRAAVAAEEGVVLLVEDWTELDYTGLGSVSEELGIIGNGSHRGFLCASCLAVRPAGRRVLGLIGQRLATRRRVRAGRPRPERRADPRRETRLWSALTQDLPVATAAGTRCVVVADRGADVLEFLDGMAAAGRSFLVRAGHNRRIDRGGGDLAKLFDHVRGRPAAGRRETTIPAAAGRAARTTTLAVAHVAVTVMAPKQPRGEVRGDPLPLHAVRVWEATPPAGVEPLEWVLLTDQPVTTAADAWERVGWYECRWQVEEFHKGLKTGCGVEQLQFTTAAALEPTIGVLSVLAAQLLRLRDAARDPEQAAGPARLWVGAVAVRAVSLWRHREERPDWTVAEYCLALARLGGHQNRKGDGPPGWITLWRGTLKLQTLLEVMNARTITPAAKQCG